MLDFWCGNISENAEVIAFCSGGKFFLAYAKLFACGIEDRVLLVGSKIKIHFNSAFHEKIGDIRLAQKLLAEYNKKYEKEAGDIPRKGDCEKDESSCFFGQPRKL